MRSSNRPPPETLQNHIAVAVMGANRHGLVEGITKAIKDCGCSISDSRMTVLGDRFTLMMLLSGTWDAIAKIETQLARLENQLQVKTVAQRTEPRRRQGDLMPYAIEVVAVDHVGIVHEITQFFSQRDIGVEDMYSGSYAAAHTGTPMFSLHMTVSVPTNVSIAGLRGEFMDFCDHLNLDAIMEPVK
ncbi:MAG TPA: ACT domain-containing protein [Gammaproteobacteria bacterium]|nr:ACT domain-containing protein [Gammaproteobacteria bacterium]